MLTAPALLLVVAAAVSAAQFPETVTRHKPDWLGKPAPERKIPAIRQWFPLGVYGGSYGKQTWAFQLDDLRQHHMNCWWMNGGGVKADDLAQLFTMGEQAGVRIVWADQSNPMSYQIRWKQRKPADRERHLQRAMQRFRKNAPRFKGRWGLAAWSVCEEMPPFVVDEVKDYFALIRKLDPTHAPLMLYNRPGAARRAAQLLKPDVVITDVYPLGRDPRCCSNNVERAKALYLRFVRTYAKIARSCDAALWVMPQAFGSHQAWKPGKPWEGWMGGYYMPNPTFCTWQAWAAIAEGATGVIYYHYYGGADHRELCMRTESWNETCQLKAIGMAFAEIEKLAPYLVQAEPDPDLVQIASTDTNVRLVGFRPKVGPKSVRLVVAVNDNIYNRRQFQLQHTKGKAARIVDLATGVDVTDASKKCALAIHAGMGKLYAIGVPADIKAFQQACGGGR
jgi:hypothetical protein